MTETYSSLYYTVGKLNRSLIWTFCQKSNYIFLSEKDVILGIQTSYQIVLDFVAFSFMLK